MRTKINGVEIEGTIEELRELLGIGVAQEIAEEESEILGRKKRKNRKSNANSNWSEAEDQELQRICSKTEGNRRPRRFWKKLARRLGRSLYACKSRWTYLKNGGVTQTRTFSKKRKKHTAKNRMKSWDVEELRYAINQYKAGIAPSRIGKALGRTGSSVRQQLWKITHGVKRV